MQDFTSYAKQPTTFDVLPAGGYIAKIIEVDDRTWSGHIEPAHLIHMDIAEGEHMGIYKKNNASSDKDRWLTYWFAEPTSGSPDWLLSKVGGIQTSLMESNDKVNLSDPHSWKGKYVGVVVGDEEAESNSGTVYTRPYVSYICSTERIRKGEGQPGGYKIPKLKRLEAITPRPLSSADVPDSFSAAEDDIPF
ncbi:MAG: hypothetical protein II637_00970 [Bacteroidales bacterium]|nr:hypothetical protein [Bacteroidales bacterium]